MTTATLEIEDLRVERAIWREIVPTDPLKREVMGLLKAWELPPSWNDSRRWAATTSGDGSVNYGSMPGDLAFRLVAVANGRWFAMPLIRAGETADFIEKLAAFAERSSIKLVIWRHPGSDHRPGSFAELVYPISEIAG